MLNHPTVPCPPACVHARFSVAFQAVASVLQSAGRQADLALDPHHKFVERGVMHDDSLAPCAHPLASIHLATWKFSLGVHFWEGMSCCGSPYRCSLDTDVRNTGIAMATMILRPKLVSEGWKM